MMDLYCSGFIQGGRPNRGPPRRRPGGESVSSAGPGPRAGLALNSGGRCGGQLVGGGGGRLVNSDRGTTRIRLVISRSWVKLVPRSTRFINVTVCSSQCSPLCATLFDCKSIGSPTE